jgi:hypothetical protein
VCGKNYIFVKNKMKVMSTNLYLSKLKVGDPIECDNFIGVVRSNDNNIIEANNPYGQKLRVEYTDQTKMDIIFDKVYPSFGHKKIITPFRLNN